MRKELKILKYHAHALPNFTDGAVIFWKGNAIDQDFAAVDRFERIGAAQYGRFTRA